MKTIIVYLPLDAEKAKLSNLPVKLPVLVEDIEKAVKENKLTKDIILRGLEAQVNTGKDLDYYLSYYVYHLYDKARDHMNRREYPQARRYIEKAVKYKKDYRYPFHLGIIEREEGNLQTSELLLKEAVSLNADFVPARLELARTLLKEGEIEDAVKTCSEILQIDPQFTLAYLIMGDAYMNLGDVRSAISLYKHALKIDPKLPSVHWRIGVAANVLQKFSLAEKEFKISISKGEGGWQAKYNLSYSLFKQGKILDALNILLAIWNEGIQNPEILTEIVLNQKLLGLYEEAIEFVETGMDMGIKEKGFLLGAIDVYAFNGLFEKALNVEEKGDEFKTRRALVKMEMKCNCKVSIEKLLSQIVPTSSELKERLKSVKEGVLPKGTFFNEEVLSIFPKVVDLCGECPYTCERLLTQSGWALSGNVDTVALLLFLYRVYLAKNVTFSIKEAIQSAALSVADVSWNVSRALSACDDNDAYDLEEKASQNIKCPSDAAAFFYMALHILDGHPNPISFLSSIGTSQWKFETMKCLLV